LFSTLRHYKCDAKQTFFLLAMIASERLAAVRSCCVSWSTRELNSVWTLFFICLCTVNWWIYSFVYNLNSFGCTCKHHSSVHNKHYAVHAMGNWMTATSSCLLWMCRNMSRHLRKFPSQCDIRY
jgi:hypothetical protein